MHCIPARTKNKTPGPSAFYMAFFLKFLPAASNLTAQPVRGDSRGSKRKIKRESASSESLVTCFFRLLQVGSASPSPSRSPTITKRRTLTRSSVCCWTRGTPAPSSCSPPTRTSGEPSLPSVFKADFKTAGTGHRHNSNTRPQSKGRSQKIQKMMHSGDTPSARC